MCGSFKTLSATLSETVYNLAEYAYLLFLEFFFLFSLGVGVSSGGRVVGGRGQWKRCVLCSSSDIHIRCTQASLKANIVTKM